MGSNGGPQCTLCCSAIRIKWGTSQQDFPKKFFRGRQSRLNGELCIKFGAPIAVVIMELSSNFRKSFVGPPIMALNWCQGGRSPNWRIKHEEQAIGSHSCPLIYHVTLSKAEHSPPASPNAIEIKYENLSPKRGLSNEKVCNP